MINFPCLCPDGCWLTRDEFAVLLGITPRWFDARFSRYGLEDDGSECTVRRDGRIVRYRAQDMLDAMREAGEFKKKHPPKFGSMLCPGCRSQIGSGFPRLPPQAGKDCVPR